MSEQKGYVDTRYLENSGRLLDQVKQRSYALMRVQPGQTVLDVGCGPGTDTLLLAQLVGPAGQVFGVDYDAAMIREADERAEKAGVSQWVSHKHGDATTLPFDANLCDACRSERLFQHLLNPNRVLSEMTRVTKPGGWIVVIDADWGTLSIDHTDVDLERRLVRFCAEQCTNTGYVGRQLYRMFKQNNLVSIEIEVVPVYFTSYMLARDIFRLDDTERRAVAAAVINETELEHWHTVLEQFDSDGVFFASMHVITVAGRKP